MEMGSQHAGSAAGKRCALNLAGTGFPQFMTENKGAFVLAIEIAGELEHGHALDRVERITIAATRSTKLILRLARIVPLVALN